MTTCYPSTTRAPQTEAQHIKPRYTVNGDKESCSIAVDLPGVKKNDVTINIDHDVLTIQGKRSSAPSEAWKSIRRELNDLDFLLRLRLNAPVEESKLSAKLEDGVLKVNLPVKEAAKPRQIQVS